MNAYAVRIAACLALVVTFAGSAGAQEEAPLPEGEGKALVARVCSTCHGLRALFVYNGDDRKWEILVHEMVAFGAQVTPEERDTILAYLKATFSSQRASAAGAGAQLPAGKGQEIVQTNCARCHGLSVIARKRADRAGWDTILRRHADEDRVKLSPDQMETVLSYLAASFGSAGGGGAAPPRD
jgi:mono/diheme cytochrome c family protein